MDGLEMILIGIASCEIAGMVTDFASVGPDQLLTGVEWTLEFPFTELGQVALLVSNEIVESFEGSVARGADEGFGILVMDGFVGGEVGKIFVAYGTFPFLSWLVLDHFGRL